MIEISLYTAIALYGSLVIIGTLAMWVYTEVTAQRVHRVMETHNLWRCSFCGFSYLDEDDKGMTKCPRCGSLNRIDDVGVKPYAVHAAREAEARAPGRNTSKSKQRGARSRGPRRSR